MDRQSRTVVTEFTLYNPPANLFTAVKLVLELSPIGQAFTTATVMSTNLFRYVTGWDNFVLACEVGYFNEGYKLADLILGLEVIKLFSSPEPKAHR